MFYRKLFFSACLAASSLSLMSGCGNSGTDTSASVKDESTNKPYLARFSEEEAVALANGEKKMFTYGNKCTLSAPDTFQREFGEFTVAAEFKGYLPVQGDMAEAKSRIIKFVERVSEVHNVVDADGNPLYKSAVNVDSSGNPIPEEITGVLPAGGKDIYTSVVTIVGFGQDLRTIMHTHMSEENGAIKFTMVNKTDAKMRMIFDVTVIKAGGTLSKTELYPYKKGYLVYSGAKGLGSNILVNSQMNAKDLTRTMLATMEAMKESL